MSETPQQPPPLPKRFYETVMLDETADGFQVMLDGRGAKTPARARLATPHRALAEGMLAEWDAQGERIDPATMPMTQRRMMVLDRAGIDAPKWADSIRAFLGSDLLCYRAGEPEKLVDRQQAEWLPFLDWAKSELSIPLAVTAGIIAVDQPPEAFSGLEAQLARADGDALSCLAAATQVTGSAVLALALWHGQGTPGDIFAASRLDERWQAELWGLDAEAEAREKQLEADFQDIAAYLAAVGKG